MIEDLKLIDEEKARLHALGILPRDMVFDLDAFFEIEVTHTNVSLEASSLTRDNIVYLLTRGLCSGAKPLKDHISAFNLNYALKAMLKMVSLKTLTFADLLYLNGLILNGENEKLGAFKRESVLERAESENRQKILDDVTWSINHSPHHPIVMSILAHNRIITNQIFEKGNELTARLVMNLILMRNGFPQVVITPREQVEYMGYLAGAKRGESNENFVKFICNCVWRSISVYFGAVKKQLPRPYEIYSLDVLLKDVKLKKNSN